MLTARGRLALLLAAGMYVAAWALGTREAYAPAIGLALAVLAAVVYVRLVRGPFRLIRRGGPGEHVEGGELSVQVEVQRDGGLPPVGARLFDTLPAVGEAQVPLFKTGDVMAGRYTLRGLPRGRYRLDKARLVIDDPFGLARSELELPAQGAIVVYPRIFELDRLFPDGGGPNGMSGPLPARPRRRLRPALGARPPARRVAAARALAVDRAPPEADGEGARGRAPRRGRGRARRARRPGRRQGARLLVRDDGAGIRLDPAAARLGGPSVGARGVRRPARAHPGDVARGRLARGARGARQRAARRPAIAGGGARGRPRRPRRGPAVPGHDRADAAARAAAVARLRPARGGAGVGRRAHLERPRARRRRARGHRAVAAAPRRRRRPRAPRRRPRGRAAGRRPRRHSAAVRRRCGHEGDVRTPGAAARALRGAGRVLDLAPEADRGSRDVRPVAVGAARARRRRWSPRSGRPAWRRVATR